MNENIKWESEPFCILRGKTIWDLMLEFASVDGKWIRQLWCSDGTEKIFRRGE